MGYQPIQVPGFGGGLNLRDDIDVVDPSQAIDALNVTYTTTGAVRQRDGYNNLTTSALTNAGATCIPYYQTAANPQLVVGCGTRVEAVAMDGSVTSDTVLTSGTWGFARFGAPDTERIYFGQGSTVLRRLTNTTFASVASTPEAGALAVMPKSNRLVAGRFASGNTNGGPTGVAGTSSPSHVYFSGAGLPETWAATDYILLTPGDGESVQAIVAWRDYVFIFKESRFAVLTGESTDAGGDPVFDYYLVDVGVGALGPKAVVAGTDGVYFASRQGIYRTTGLEPERVSDLVAPIFDSSSEVSDFFGGGVMLQSQAANTALWWHNDRLYVGYTTTGTANNYTLEYDPSYGWWSLHDLPAAAGASIRRSSTPELVFADTTNKHVYYSNASQTSDDGTAITSRWRSGWTDFDSPLNKTVRRSEVWGQGVVRCGLSQDFELGTGTLETLDFIDPSSSTWGGTTWGGSTWASPAQLIGQHRRESRRGTAFSLSFFNNTLNQTWSVHRVEQQLRIPRQPGVLQTEVTTT